MFSKLKNPFDFLTDNQLLLFGMLGYLIHSFFSSQWNYIADGIIQLHQISSIPFWYPFVNNAINILVLTGVLFIFGKMIYTKTRIIDVLNVVWFAQLVQVLLAIIIFNPISQKFTSNIQIAIENHDFQLKTVPVYELVIMGAISIFAILGLVYYFYLLITGMKIAIYTKKTIHGILIILITLIVDVILKFSYPYLV